MKEKQSSNLAFIHPAILRDGNMIIILIILLVLDKKHFVYWVEKVIFQDS